ncbi:beta-lactamase family protein [Nonomuraea sp. NN258]|uniref:serine hydrolase domain-containing protein n=1 Tax=Nonomuraea antri TaxID=2730852 RepID=UPI001569E601|nr:serine hydrolase domain-containing protein [Nonomuraea antri]NRQ33088.1 beta-lactamase family protein [Nonomuraea antri]
MTTLTGTITEAVAGALGPARHLGAQLYVSVAGETVCDLAAGVRDDGSPIDADDLLVWFSGGKPFLAAAVCRLWQSGLLDLDAPVRGYVPEFGTGRAREISCRHLLTHTGGRLVVADPDGVTSAFRVDYERALRVVLGARLHPQDRPGRQSSYASSTLSWILLAEVVKRVTGRPFDTYVAEEICAPLGVESHYGFTRQALEALGNRVTTYRTPRSAHYVHGADAAEGEAIQRVLAGGTFHRSVDPGAGLWASARGVGRFYELLLRRACGHDGDVVSAGTVAEMIRPQRPSYFEEAPLIDFGLGLTLESRRHGEAYAYFGSHTSPGAFGHQGHGSPMAFADPAHELVVSFNGNGLPGRVVGKRIWRAISDAVYTHLGLARHGPAPVAAVRPGRVRTIDLRPQSAADELGGPGEERNDGHHHEGGDRDQGAGVPAERARPGHGG